MINLRTLSEIKKELTLKIHPSRQRNATEEGSSLNRVKVIGMTGSRGKSTIAFLVHEYLKFKGKKSILYSSLGVDSPVSFKAYAPVETAINNEETILEFLEEAEEYNADYLVLEVNETTIDKGLVDNFPFAVRALTGIVPGHSMLYDVNYYINLKKRFLRESNFGEKLVFGLTRGTTKEMMDELLTISANEKILFGSNHVIQTRGYKPSDFDFILKNERNYFKSLKGLDMEVIANGVSHELHSRLILPFHTENILCVLSILKACDELEIETFKDFLSEAVVPGREEVIHFKGRMVILSMTLNPQLEELKKMNHNKLLVVAGAEGVDFKSFIKEFPEEVIYQEKVTAVKKAALYLKQYADKVYLTTNNNANFKASKFLDYQAAYLEGFDYEIILSRRKAIQKAIQDANEGDIIYIAGRGNREKFLDSFEEMSLFSDKEEILSAIDEMEDKL
ncbi:MAG: Mur ligase family protein [Erysipelotrichales bacterium]|nr:Mur ligase family protein [Erysipelotrichales bacterium]